MSLVALCLGLTLGAPAPAVDAVLITRKTGVTPAQAAELQAQLTRALEANELAVKLSGPALQATLKKLGVRDAWACNGRRSCVTELTRQLQATALVSVSVTRIEDETAVALELVRPDEGLPPVKDSLILLSGKSALEPLVAAFAQKAREALGGAAQPVEPGSPPLVSPRLLPDQPTPTPPPAVIVESPGPVSARAAPVAFATAGGVFLAAGVALVIVSAVLRGELQPTSTWAGLPSSSLTEADAQRKNTEANVTLGAGLGAAVVGAGLATGALLTW